MKGFEKVLSACGFVAFLAVLLSPSVMAQSQSYTFPWATTFDFPDIYSGSVSNATDYLFPTLSPDTITSNAQAASYAAYDLNYSGNSGTEYTQVQSAANRPGGAGGNGLRFWVGYDGSDSPNYNNVHSDPVDLFLGTNGNPGNQYPELWFRYYVRYQSGFQWVPASGLGGVSGGGPSYSKNIYIWSTTMSNPAVILEYANTDNYVMAVQLDSGGTSLSGNSGWQTVQCGGNSNLTSDGSWHCFEAHIKADTDGSNGVAELWIDNVQQFSQSNVNFGTPGGWSVIEFNSNVSNPANSGVNYYIDYDDIAISTTGRVGPLFSVTASVSDADGSVSPQSQAIVSGGTASVIITPNSGYSIAGITDNGQTVSIADPYVITNVIADHAVVVTFSPDPGGGGSGGRCFIATAAFGSYQEKHVRTLRQFRDTFLLTNMPGKAFVEWYYRHSPKYAVMIAGRPSLRAVVRTALLPVYGAAFLSLKGFPVPLILIIPCAVLAYLLRGQRRRRSSRRR